MPSKISNSISVQSVDRALMIIEFLKNESNGLGVTELANRMNVAKSTIHRLLTSLQNYGFVKKDYNTDRYKLGLKLIEIGNIVANSLDIRKVSSNYLQDLVRETRETAHLVIIENGEIVYIDKVESTETIRMYSQIGRRAPVHCTGAGKAILAYLPTEDIKDIVQLKGLTKYTENTNSTYESLVKNLKLIRENGYSVDNEEHEMGIRCVGAPIFDFTGKVVAGLSVTGPIMRMTDEKLSTTKDIVMFYANEISKKMGYRR